MPTYDYSCRSCGARFEVWQKMSDEPLTTCPTCGGEIHRIVYPVGLVFKGSGFYSTDNRKSGGNGATSATAASPASADSTSEGASGTSETKTESKPEAKPETVAAKAATTE
jgi:putative FmdB family regulatory protein